MSLRTTPHHRRPMVGITGRRIAGRTLTTAPAFESAPVDAYLTEYAESVARAGGLPMHLPIGLVDAPDEVAALADRLDALVLAGGADVDPRTYGSVVTHRSGVIEPERDRFEFALLAAFMAVGKPVLGICRGAQLINVALGGTLVADLPDDGTGQAHSSYAYPRDFRRHAVTCAPGSVAHRLYGDVVEVNSFHHQSVAEPGQDVVTTGYAADGVVEVIEVAGLPVLGLQWHPECFAGDPVFDWLTSEAVEFAATLHAENNPRHEVSV